jgi:hypothetical protein
MAAPTEQGSIKATHKGRGETTATVGAPIRAPTTDAGPNRLRDRVTSGDNPATTPPSDVPAPDAPKGVAPFTSANRVIR